MRMKKKLIPLCIERKTSIAFSQATMEAVKECDEKIDNDHPMLNIDFTQSCETIVIDSLTVDTMNNQHGL